MWQSHVLQETNIYSEQQHFSQLGGKSNHNNLDLVSAASLAATADPHRHMSLMQLRRGQEDVATITENYCAAFKEFTDLKNEAIITICYWDSYTNREMAICHIMSDP